MHGVHHTWPRDKYRLVMPPAVSITLYFVFGAIFYYAIGPVYSFGFHAGFVAGYMFYDLTHYWIHHFSPRTEYGRELKKNHMLHHFKDHASRFCVSNLVWTSSSARAERSDSRARRNQPRRAAGSEEHEPRLGGLRRLEEQPRL